MSVKTDNVNVVVMVDGKQAVNQLGELEMKSRDLKASLKDMKKGTDDYIQANKQLDKVTGDIKQLRDQIGIAGLTMNQLRSSQRDLNKELNNVTEGTEQYEHLKTKLQEVNGVISKQQSEIRKAGEAAKESGGLMERFAGPFLAELAAKAVERATEAVIDFAKESVASYREAQQATAQLEASLKSTGFAAGLTEHEITSLSMELQELTNIDHNVTNSAASLLLTFTKVKDEVFKEAIPLIQDMAVKMAGGSGGEIDLKSATIQVGKALEDPVKGLTALAKAGVSFTEQQKEQIKTMVATGNVAGAQKIILAELNTEFGGSAEAAAKAQGGAGKLKVVMEELSEKIGGTVVPIIDELSESGVALVENLDPVFHSIQTGITPIQNLWESIGRLITTFVPLGDKASGASLIMKALSFAINLILAPIKFTYLAVNTWIDSMIVLINVGKQVANFFGASFEPDISGSWEKLTGNIVSNSESIINSYKGVTDAASKAADAIKKHNELISKDKEETVKNDSEIEVDYRKMTMAQLKAINDEGAKAEIARRKAVAAELKKEADQYLKDQEAAERNIQKLKLELYGKTLNDEIALLKDKAEQEKAIVKGTALQQQQQRDLIEENTQKDIAAIEEKYRLSEEVQRKAGRDAEAAYDREIAGDAMKAKQAILDLEISNAGKNKDKVLDLEKQKLFLKLQYDLSNEQLTEDERLAINKEYEKKIKALEDKDRVEKIKNATEDMHKTSDLIGQVDQLTQALSNRQIQKETDSSNKKIKILDAELAAKKITQESYDAQKKQIDDDAAKKLAAIKTKQAKIDKAAALAQAVIQGALAVVSNLASGGIPGAILAGITSAISIAKIIATPIPTFAKGGYTSFAQGGHVGSGQLGIIGEAGPEYVISNPMMRNPRVANFVGMLENMRTARKFADGGFTTTDLLNTGRVPLTPETNTLQSAPNPGNQGNQQNDQSAQQLIVEVKGLRQDIKDMQGRLKVVYTDIEDMAAQVNKVRIDSSLT